jgi:transcriptional regulator with PAS, ATPase and Fis domain
MSPYLQAKLLRVIETKEIDKLGDVKKRKINARIIATTNRDIVQEIKDGRFREDLYFRLAQMFITVPPLRTRKDDIPTLIEHYLLVFSKDSGGFKHIDKDVLDMLVKYDWPGNVRELINSLKRAAIMCDGDQIKLDDLPLHLKSKQRLNANTYSDTLLDDAISAMEKQMIIDALKKTKGSQAKAAKLLGISERSMWYRVKKYGVVD